MASRPKMRAKKDEMSIRPYIPEPTAQAFHRDNSDVRGIMGPVGTGKTVICCMEALSRIVEMPPCADGVRRSRWAFIRNSYPELISTTMNTWRDWVPDHLCHIVMSPPITGKLDFELEDGTRVKAEIIFLAIDRPEDTRKLKSLELTGAFLNEASELDETVVSMALQRTGRYPAVIDGMEDDYWTGVIMDTNPPSDDHWWHELAEIKQPINHRFWRQPPAIFLAEKKDPDDPDIYIPNEGQRPGIAKAENVQWQKLGYDYWLRQSHGASREWIKVYLEGEYGTILTGKPVFPEYSDALHYANGEIDIMRGLPLIISFDFGLTPACAFIQQTPQGVVNIVDERVSEDMDLRTFVENVINPCLNTDYAGMSVYAVGDPAGSQRSQTDGATCMNILRECGLRANPSPDASNSFSARRDAVGFFLSKLVNGKPAFRMSSKCPILRKGFLGNYHYREIRTGGLMGSRRRFNETPDKNFYSHIHDALQYGMIQIKDGIPASATPTVQAGQRRRIVQVDTGAYT